MDSASSQASIHCSPNPVSLKYPTTTPFAIRAFSPFPRLISSVVFLRSCTNFPSSHNRVTRSPTVLDELVAQDTEMVSILDPFFRSLPLQNGLEQRISILFQAS